MGNKVSRMPQEKAKARKAVRAVQKQFDRESEAAQRARRKAFAQAQKEGLSLREIAEEIGLTHSRVGQIINGPRKLGDCFPAAYRGAYCRCAGIEI